MHLAEMRERELEAKVMSATRSTQRIKGNTIATHKCSM